MAQVITPCCPAASANAAAVHHRDQDQIRSRLLSSLGIFPALGVPTAPPASSTSSCCTSTSSTISSSSSCSTTSETTLSKVSIKAGSENHLQENLKYKSEDIASKPDSMVSFVDVVSVVEIPSHRDYGQDIRHDLWNGVAAVAALVQRNSLEFQSEQNDWRQVLEEDEFVRLPSGELLHPVTYQKRLQRIAHEKRLKKKKQLQKQQGYKSIAACLNFPTHNYNPPAKKKTPTRKRCGGGVNTTARVVRKVKSQQPKQPLSVIQQ